MAIIAETLGQVNTSAADVFEVTLTTEGVERLVTPRLPNRIRLTPLRWHIDNPRLSVTMRTHDRVLGGYSLSIQGVLTIGDRRRDVAFEKRRNLTDPGRTHIELPENIVDLIKD